MPDPKDALVGVSFHHGSPPYEAGDVAGFPRPIADRYVASGRAVYLIQSSLTGGTDAFNGMSRGELLAYAREHLGLTDDPPAAISDDEIRAGLRSQAGTVDAPADTTSSADPAPDAKSAKPK